MWSIGIYAGESPFALHEAPGIVNPVLTCESVADVPARFVADPFMVNAAGRWHMFFEVLNQQTEKGEIGLATSADGLTWAYQQIVLVEEFHLSYPHVFEWQNKYFMIPETLHSQTGRLYQADPFPTRWSLVGTMIEGKYADPSVFRHQERWWMFACTTPFQHDELRLYFADELMGPWTEHPSSPIIASDKRNARPAGRVLVSANGIIRLAQDCVMRYGNKVRAFDIHELTPTTYAERECPGNPILRPSGHGWNAMGMHHLDAHPLPEGGWLACVDGMSEVD